jgi:hypothetical protein
MSYTPHEWSTGDTITAARLNALENGVGSAGSVASVCVNWNDGGMSGSVLCYVGYAKAVPGEDFYSIESPLNEHYCTAPYTGRDYFAVPLPPSGDGFKAYVFFNESYHSMALFDVEGNISDTEIEALVKIGSSEWNSAAYYGFEVTGDGTIAVSYND